MLRVQTARENNDACIAWQTRSEEIIEWEWPAAVVAKMENPFSRKELYSPGRLAANEALLVPEFVRYALWIGPELLLQRYEFADGEAEERRLPETLKGRGLVPRQNHVI